MLYLHQQKAYPVCHIVWMLLLIPISFLPHLLLSKILLPTEWILQIRVHLSRLRQFLQLFPNCKKISNLTHVIALQILYILLQAIYSIYHILCTSNAAEETCIPIIFKIVFTVPTDIAPDLSESNWSNVRFNAFT